MNPFLFEVGCQRSGTTLLQRMLDHHPQLCITNGVSFIPLVIEEVPLGVDPPVTPELVEEVRHSRRFDRLGLSDAMIDVVAAQALTYSQFVSALYSASGRLREKPLAGEKCASFVRYIPRLHSLFPWARIIHLIRDGREIALSTLEWARGEKGPSGYELWREEPVGTCALWWRWQVRIGRRDGASLGSSSYHEVRYEDLVAEPETTLRQIAAFLGLPFAPEMLTYHEGMGRTQGHKNAWRPPMQGLRDWRTQMTARDRDLFEALAGDLLSELGYERSATSISPEIAAVADECRRRWELERTRQSSADTSSE